MKNIIKIWLLSLLTFGASAVDELVTDAPGLLTKAFLFDECPISKNRSQSLGVGLAALIIPPLIEKGIKGIGTAIKKAGEEKTFNYQTDIATEFYSINKDSLSVHFNANNHCMVIIRGIFGAEKPNFKSKLVNQSPFKDVSNILFGKTGLLDLPVFYAEYILRKSIDQSAFRLEPKIIYRNGTFSNNRKIKDLVLNITFSKPDVTGNGSAFANFTTKFIGKKVNWLVRDRKLLENYGSGFMPLPSLSDKANENQSKLQALYTQKVTLKKQLDALLKKEDPKLVAKRKKLKKYIDLKDNELLPLREKLEISITNGADKNEIKKIESEIEKKTIKSEYKQLIARLEEDIEKIVKLGLLQENTQTTVNSLNTIDKKVKNLLKSSRPNTPVNIKVHFIETKNANKFLVDLGEVLEGQAEAATNLIKDEITGVASDARETQNLVDLTSMTTLRKTAIESVNAWRLKQTEYEAANEGERVNLLAGLRTAYLTASLDCKIVESKSIVEPSCLTLIAPPTP